jgi:hypothetical protein
MSLFDTFTPREKKDWKNLQSRIQRARKRARARGEAWTPYRPFVKGSWEIFGKAICGWSGRHRNGRCAVEVSYSVYMKGCVVRCAECHDRGI